MKDWVINQQIEEKGTERRAEGKKLNGRRRRPRWRRRRRRGRRRKRGRGRRRNFLNEIIERKLTLQKEKSVMDTAEYISSQV